MQNKTLLKRFVAVSIDTSIAGIVYVLLTLILFRFGLKNQYVIKFFLLPERLSSYMYIISVIAIFIVQEAFFGKTIAKKIMGLYVINEELEKPTLIQSVIRNIFRITDQVFFIGLLTIVFNKKNQRFGDIIAKTFVVDKKELEILRRNKGLS